MKRKKKTREKQDEKTGNERKTGRITKRKGIM